MLSLIYCMLFQSQVMVPNTGNNFFACTTIVLSLNLFSPLVNKNLESGNGNGLENVRNSDDGN